MPNYYSYSKPRTKAPLLSYHVMCGEVEIGYVVFKADRKYWIGASPKGVILGRGTKAQAAQSVYRHYKAR